MMKSSSLVRYDSVSLSPWHIYVISMDMCTNQPRNAIGNNLKYAMEASIRGIRHFSAPFPILFSTHYCNCKKIFISRSSSFTAAWFDRQ